MSYLNRNNSLMPEAPVLVYPSLAATIGLEESVMLSVLTAYTRYLRGMASNNYEWFVLSQEQVTELMPFWQPADVQRIATNLREKGLILLASAPFIQCLQLKFAFNGRREHAPAPRQETASPSFQAKAASKNLIAPGWQPDRETLDRLAQHAIPAQFALASVPEFVNYWRERGVTAYSWGTKFMQHVLRLWREHEAQENARTRESLMPRNWKPSPEAMEVLTLHAGISRSFVEDAIPEFELYWREQGGVSDNWNKKFRDHVQRQWLRYQSALEHDTLPRRIPENWRPSADVDEVLHLANIDLAFARALIPEFVIYWRDTNQVHASWNTKFLQYVKQRWAQRGSTMHPSHKSTRELSLVEQLTDRSWAL